MPKPKETRWTASVLGDEVYDARGVVARVAGAPDDRKARARLIAAAPALLAALEEIAASGYGVETADVIDRARVAVRSYREGR